MKHVVILFVIAISAILSPKIATAQTADEIVQKHINAIGGLEKWEKVNSVIIKGSVSQHGMEMPVKVTKLQGKGMKFEYSMGEMKGFALFTDKDGWAYNSYSGKQPQEMPQEIVKQKLEHLDAQGVLIDYKKKGHSVSFDGIENQQGTACYRLIVKTAAGNVHIMYIDTVNYYCLKMVEKVISNGEENEQSTIYGNYQKIAEGILFPMLMDVGSGPVVVSSVEINKPIPEDFFLPNLPGSGK